MGMSTGSRWRKVGDYKRRTQAQKLANRIWKELFGTTTIKVYGEYSHDGLVYSLFVEEALFDAAMRLKDRN